ncbi:MAG TPA: class I SAM-dependent methyltransferase [Desulfobacteria bacterium]|nr:class I SAM-dependent methyltransferase [Desulfobacteria bacterium]
MEQTLIVTTVKDKPELSDAGVELAKKLGCLFVPRNKRSFPLLAEEYRCDVIVTVGKSRLAAWVGGEEFFFHPSMALLRIMGLIKGETDRMVEAMQLKPGMSVLDCTLGFASDAAVASFVSGPSGRVVGLEASPVTATLVRHGLSNFRAKLHNGLEPAKAEALRLLPPTMQRITVVNTAYLEYFAHTAENSFDVVYFDPMFRIPQEGSASISPLRRLACPDRVADTAIREACRVARRRVILKESYNSAEFARLGFKLLPGGRYSRVAFGTIEL